MHSAGFIHGDLKIDNCLLRLEDVPGGSGAWSGMYQSSGELGWRYKGIKMIDFGRTVDTHMFPSGQQFTSDWKADVYDCLEMRLQKPWTFQPDYYGLAGIIYGMLFGKHFDTSTVLPTNPSEEPVRYKPATATQAVLASGYLDETVRHFVESNARKGRWLASRRL